MESIKENHPFIFGWIAFISYGTALSWIFQLAAAYLGLRFIPFVTQQNLPYLSLGLGFVCQYLGFYASVHWLALPLSLRTKNLIVREGRKLLIIEWILFSFMSFIFNLPLGFLHILVPSSEQTQRVISIAWMTLISYSTYNLLIKDFVHRSTMKELPENSEQSLAL